MARRGIRATRRGQKKAFDAEALAKQEGLLLKIYQPEDSSIFDTTDSAVGETAKQIARKILLEKYSEFPFEDQLEEIMKRGGDL